ncbi:MAG: hypothetical protein WB555_16625 [Candidatus Korobacteraceae bacterium]
MDLAWVTPDLLVPAPLVSKKVEFPIADAQLRKDNPLSVYFEIYEPLLEANKADVSYSVRITELKTGSIGDEQPPIRNGCLDVYSYTHYTR